MDTTSLHKMAMLSIIIVLTTIKTYGSIEDNLVYTCPATDTIFETCLPALPDYLSDNTSNNDEDRLWYEAIDANSTITNSCNTIVIRVEDQQQNPFPITCADFLIVRRIVSIYDGDPNDPLIIPQVCQLIYKVTVPFYLQRNSFPSATVVACDEDISTAYQDFLDNFGYTDYDSPCSAVISDVNNPQYQTPPTVINYSVSNANPNGCGSTTNPGNGFITVLFWMIDECGHTAESIATFRVVDDMAPSFSTCPDDISIDLATPNLLTIINMHLSSASAVDNCSQDVLIFNDFEPGFIDLSACSDQTIIVNYQADDGCGNINNSCNSQLTVISDETITITCPNSLTLECGDQNNEILVSNWMATARATDAQGNLLNQLTNNFDLSSLNDPTCNSNIGVSFTATDDCSNTATCMASIIIADTTAPTLNCPADIFIDPFMSPDWQEKELQDWFSAASSEDNCGSTIITNNFSISLFQGCEPMITEQIAFRAEDQCGNLSFPCSSSITVFGGNDAQILCPSNLIIECGDSNNNSIVMDWLESSSAISSSGAPLIISYGNFSISQINVFTCSDEFIVNFNATDICMGNTIDLNCNSTIRIQDSTPPQLICPPTLTINSNTVDNQLLVDQWLTLATATDNCSVATLSSNYISVSDFCSLTGPLDVTFYATDNCGFTATACIGRINVNQDSPIITCPNNLVLECGDPNNLNAARAHIETAVSIDNTRSSLAVSNNFNPNQITNTGCSTSFNVIFSSTDNCNNNVSCSANISVNDSTAPNYINGCPPALTLKTNMSVSEKEQAYTEWIAEISISDCNPTTLTDDFDTSTFTIGGMETTIPVNFSLQDTCGWIAQPCASSIIITDNGGGSTDRGLVITEIMYNSPGEDLEFLEFYNNGPDTLNLGGYEVVAGVKYTFPEVLLAPEDIFLVTNDSLTFDRFYFSWGIAAYEWTSGSLSNSGEQIVVTDSQVDTIINVTYDIVAPWPHLANGLGPSIILCDLNSDSSDPDNWAMNTNKSHGFIFSGEQVFSSPGTLNECEETFEFWTTPMRINRFPESAGRIEIPIYFESPGHNGRTMTAFLDGAATIDEDFRIIKDTLTWENGQMTPEYIIVEIIDDVIPETAEGIPIYLFDLNGEPNFNFSGGAIRIMDNDIDEEPRVELRGIIETPQVKAIELNIMEDFFVLDLDQYGIGSANNGNGSDSTEFSIYAGQTLLPDHPTLFIMEAGCAFITNDTIRFKQFFGPFDNTRLIHHDDMNMSFNGNDAIELFYKGELIDVFGNVDEDGEGTAWEYTDGWAKRKSSGSSTDFFVDDWDYSGVGVLDVSVNSAASNPYPLECIPTAVGEVKEETVVRIFPNPTNGVINLVSEERIESIQIIDITGKTIYKELSVADRRALLDISGISAGIYFIQYSISGKSGVQKIVVE